MTALIDAPSSANGAPAATSRGRAAGDRMRSAATVAASGARGFGRWVARRGRIGSALGWTLLVVAILAGTAAALLGWAEMLALGAGAALVLVTAVPFVLTRTAYEVAVELASSRVSVGDQAVGRLVVRNTAKSTAASTRVILPVGAARPEFRMPRIPAGGEHDELFTIPTQRRAVLTLGPVTSVRSDPLGALRREVDWTEPTPLYIHPRVVPLGSDTVGILRDLEGLPTRDLADDDMSFHALREYQAGDDLRHVHWTSTARMQALMIRQFEQTRRSHLVVALATDPAAYADSDEFELAVSIAGSIGITALRDGKTLSTVTAAGALPSKSTTMLLDALSGIDCAAKTASLERASRSIASVAPGASVVILVTGSAGEMGELRSASLRIPPTARTIVLRAASGGQLARRAIGDLVAAYVPELSSLRRAFRAVAS